MSDRLVIFAREPVAGRVKTRLATGIGGNAATEVYRRLLEHTIESARATGIDAVVFLAEVPGEAWASTLDHPFEIQGAGDLGRRMGECFSRGFADGASRVVLVGSDNAHIRQDHIRSAFDALGDHRVVLGPADDGGYWLVGQRRPGIDFFSRIPWSDPATLDATRQRLRKLHVAWSELDTLPDIDTAEDLRRAINDPRIDDHLRRRLRTIAGTL